MYNVLNVWFALKKYNVFWNNNYPNDLDDVPTDRIIVIIDMSYVIYLSQKKDDSITD